MIDADEVEAQTPMRVALTALRGACGRLRVSDPQTLVDAALHMKTSKDIAMGLKDHALLSALASFEAYISVAAAMGQIEENVLTNALSALEQLAALPQGYIDARDSVAIALGKAIQKKLAA